MLTRRKFIATAVATGVGATGALTFRSLSAGSAEYEQAVQRTWRHGARGSSDAPAVLRELVRYATLAPSSHNSQCWKFRLGDQSVAILPDYRRRCPIVDPDDHHLFVSLGCAAENLVQAASAMGFRDDTVFNAGANESLDIALVRATESRSPLFEAIPRRQSTRREFDGQPLANGELRLLESAGTGNGVRVHLLTDRQAMENVLDFVVQGNTAQMRDPAFVRELKDWLRFNGGQAARLGDGLFAGCSGNPSAPGWLGGLMFDLFFTEKAENDKYARHVRSSAGIAVFVSEREDKKHWVEAGRALQRFALQATAMDVRTAHLNQPVEVAALRSQFAESIGISTGRPDLVIRFGRGPGMPRSLRRPVEAVLL
ncbi:MAG: Tat pathway signal protein [Gammaproteobacteria bacterium]|nr:Tat pathway signal protein [Gammaproteobacteria bacterium]